MSFYAFSSCWVGSVEANNPKKRRPDESQLMACLFLRVAIHDKKCFDSSFQVYIHIFMKDSLT